MPNAFAFIDGTHMHISHPTEDQEEYYSGQKHFHSIKYQAIMIPDSIMVHVGGPFSGCQHDSYMANDLSMLVLLLVCKWSCMGMKAMESNEIKAPFRGNVLTPEQATHNESI
jgi:hypothetical protein